MSYCPECRTEYQPHAAMCADCGVALVAVLPPLPAPQRIRDELTVIVHRAQDVQEATMLVAMLEEQGLRAALSREGPGYNLALHPFVTGLSDNGIEVFQSQADEARELIAAYLNVPELEVTVEDEEREQENEG